MPSYRIALVIVSLMLCVHSLHAQAKTEPPAKYAESVKMLREWIEWERKTKDIPSISIAMVDDQQVVWAEGFGFADSEKKKPATADTIYRVGSVSKPFTALLLMLFVELGFIDLDEPIQTYLPDFRPKNPYKKKITIRQLLCHKSGLVRESPVGNYFDDSSPSLEKTVLSLNDTTLIYEPETKTSYSNAGLSAVGLVMERMKKKPFARLIEEKLLHPLKMTSSSYLPTPELNKRIAYSTMWTYFGREFPAPPIELGTLPAGCLYSSANDMARGLKFIFARGKGPNGRLLKEKTLKDMFRMQFAKKDDKRGFGLGFFLSEFEGKRKTSHGGAIYGFSTEFAALPDEKVGVVVMSAKDVTNGVTRHIGEIALRHLLEIKAGKPLTRIVKTSPVQPEQAKVLAGRYVSEDKKVLELVESDGRLFLRPNWLGLKVQVRQLKDELIVDDVLLYGPKIHVDGECLTFREEEFTKTKVRKPQPCPKKWQGLIGEYGWDFNVMYIFEKDQQLYSLIEWVGIYPLTEVSENVYKFPDFGLYHGDKLVFYRDKTGKATRVNAANVIFPRRPIMGEDGKTFRLKPVQPLAKLRKKALKATPPKEDGKFRKSDPVDLGKLAEGLKFDIRYAGKNNFLGSPFYTKPKAFMQRPAAEALVRVHRKLKKKGYGLLIFDAYRPWHVTKMFWDATPVQYHDFVADPSKGSRHNRGCAVDLTLYDLKTGKPVSMVAGFDEFTDRAYADYIGGTHLQRWHRKLLRNSMEEEGFRVYEAEWWHFDYHDWQSFAIGNQTFEEIE